MCGALTYRADAEPINVRVCHCMLCQKSTGAPFFARVQVPLNTIQISGPVRWFASSTQVDRGFCERCGSTLFSKRERKNVIGLGFGSLDNPNNFSPQEHIWVSEQQTWLRFADDLPIHTGSAPD
jgi:hypothetical protein